MKSNMVSMKFTIPHKMYVNIKIHILLKGVLIEEIRSLLGTVIKLSE